MFDDPPKPVEDGYEFTLEQDSLANAMGARLPNRSLWMVQGEVGSGKSLVSQRLIYGLLENGSKILVVTTELTTRGWIEQMESIGYPVTDYIASGRVDGTIQDQFSLSDFSSSLDALITNHIISGFGSV